MNEQQIAAAARALWRTGNARIGERAWESVAAHYIAEATVALAAALAAGAGTDVPPDGPWSVRCIGETWVVEVAPPSSDYTGYFPHEAQAVAVRNALNCVATRVPAREAPHDKFAPLRILGANWDSYGAVPISEKAIEAARNFLDWSPTGYACVIPRSNGGVQLEWHFDRKDVEISFDADGSVSSVFAWDADDDDANAATPSGASSAAALQAQIEKLRQPHLRVEEDCWYSCPLALDERGRSECCNDAIDKTKCDCGADAHNAILDDALRLLDGVAAFGTVLQEALDALDDATVTAEGIKCAGTLESASQRAHGLLARIEGPKGRARAALPEPNE